MAWAAGAVVVRDGFRLGPVDVQIDVGDRVAVVGANGAGKTTLVQLLLGRIEPAEGAAGLGRSVVLGEIDQVRAALADASDAARGVHGRDGTDRGGGTNAPRQVRTRCRPRAPPPVDAVAGRAHPYRVALLQAHGANLLVLDEPTNHLDIEAIEQLEQALDSFAGTIVLVTHDRTLLERVHITRTLHVAGGQVTEG